MKLQDSFANYSKVQEFQTSYMGILENSAWADPDHIHQTMREHSAIVIPITCVLFNSYREKGRLRLRSNAVIPAPFHQKAYAGAEPGTLHPSYCRMLQGICDKPLSEIYAWPWEHGLGSYGSMALGAWPWELC